MRVHRIKFMKAAKQLSPAALVLGLITGLCVLSFQIAGGERVIHAQVSPLPSTSTGQLGISPEEPVAPPRPITVRAPAPNPASPTSTEGQKSQASQTAPVKEAMPEVPEPDPNNPVAVQSANLLKMAYGLKLEVDKTSKDMLSVAVVRKAAEIEQAARKLRTR